MSSPQVNVITDSSVNIILISNVDEKQETENPFLINLRVIFLSLLNLKYLSKYSYRLQKCSYNVF